MDITWEREVVGGLRVMEGEAMDVVNESVNRKLEAARRK